MTSALFSSIKLAHLALDNRIVVSPMCQYSADDSSANDWDFVCVSSGGISAEVKIALGPGYQVASAEKCGARSAFRRARSA